MNLIFDLKMKGYIDCDYKVTDKTISDIETGDFSVPIEFQPFQFEIVQVIRDIHTTDNFKPIENDRGNNIEVPVLLPNINYQKKEFQDLWNKINTITSYEVNFDSEELITKSIGTINSKLEVNKVTISVTT